MSASHLDLRCRLGKGNLIHMLMPVGSVKLSTEGKETSAKQSALCMILGFHDL